MRRDSAAAIAVVFVLGCRSSDDATLTFWTMGHEGERVATILEPFLRAHPEIHLNLQVIPWNAAHDKLLTAYAGHATPDVCQLGNTWVTELNAMKALARLDERVDKSTVVDRSDFFEGIWRANVIDGGVYGIPWYVDTRALFYRTDRFAEGGLTHAPETWAELASITRTVTRDVDGDGNPDQRGIALPPNPNGSPIPLFFAWQNGADLLDAEQVRGAVRSPAFAEAVEFYADFFRSGAAARETGQQTNFHHAFAEGAFASFVSGPWDVKALRDSVPSFTGWAVAPLPPRFPGGSRASLAGGSSLVIFESAKHPEQAWALIEYLSRPEVQVAFYRATADLPARRSAWKDAAIADDPPVHAFYAQLEYARPPPQVPEWEQLADKLGGRVEQIVYGSLTTPQAMDALQDDIDAILEKRRWLKARGRK